MTDFADQLFQDLMAAHGDELSSAAAPAAAPASARRHTRPAWAAAGTVAAAGAAAVGFTVFGSTASAYAVTDNHDGTVTVSVTDATGIAGANARLHQLGGSVLVLKATPGCPSIASFAAPDQNIGRMTIGVHGRPGRAGGAEESGVTVRATGLPKDETMLIAFDFDHPMHRMAAVMVDNPVPTCVSLPSDPPNGNPTGGAPTVSGGGQLSRSGGPDSGTSPVLNQQNG